MLVVTQPVAGVELFGGEDGRTACTGDDHDNFWLTSILVDPDEAGSVPLGALLDALGKRDVQGLLVEGGATLQWAFVRDDLVDRVVVYLAPRIVGGSTAPGVVDGAGFVPIDGSLPLRFTAVTRLGPDLKVEADVQRDR